MAPGHDGASDRQEGVRRSRRLNDHGTLCRSTSARFQARLTKLKGSSMAHVGPQPIVRLAELEIDPAQLDAYKVLLAQEMETSVQTEPAVLALNAVSVKGAPANIRILEVYAHAEGYEAHLNSPHFLKYKNGTASMVGSLRLIETDPILLCSK
jgi:quinol monooxygenase YgiN